MSVFDLYRQPAYEMTAEDRAEEAAERREHARDEYIDFNVTARTKALMSSPDFAWTAMGDLSRDVLAGFAEDLGAFFERYHAGNTDTELAQAGYSLYRTLKPYVEAAAESQAKDELAVEFDRDLAA